MSKIIKLASGHEAIIDDDDYELVQRYSWFLTTQRYAASQRGRLKMHHLIVKELNTSTHEVHHKNYDTLDNRKDNLVIVTFKEHKGYSGPPKSNTSGYKGISKNRDKWAAKIKIDGKLTHLGSFETKEIAARIYNHAAIKHFGPNAYQNPINDNSKQTSNI